MIESMLKVMEGFHHQVDQRIARMPSWIVGEEVWEWSSVAKVWEVVGLWPIKEYIGGVSIPLRSLLQTAQFINCAHWRGRVDSCGGEIWTLTRSRSATVPVRE